MRDSQRKRVYSAENRARRVLTEAGFEWRNVATEARYNRRVVEIMGSRWMKSTYPDATHREVVVNWGGKRRGASAGYLGITTSITEFALHELVLVHELSHTIEKRLKGVTDPGHGRDFCQIYLKLVRRFIGKRAHDELKAQFREFGVKYLPKRERASGRVLPPALAAANEQRRDEAARRFGAQIRSQFMPGVQVYKRHRLIAVARPTNNGTVIFDVPSAHSNRYWDELDISMDDRDLYTAWKAFLAKVAA